MSEATNTMVQYSSRGSSIVAEILVDQMRDQATVEGIKGQLIKAFTQDGNCRHAIIDLNRVSFVGSIGLLAFLAVRRISGVESVWLCRVHPNVQEMFRLCRLIRADEHSEGVFRLAENADSALLAISGQLSGEPTGDTAF